MRMNKAGWTAVYVIFAVIALIMMILGRIHTADMTEVHAFINGWRYWLGVVVFAALSIYCLRAALK